MIEVVLFLRMMQNYDHFDKTAQTLIFNEFSGKGDL